MGIVCDCLYHSFLLTQYISFLCMAGLWPFAPQASHTQKTDVKPFPIRANRLPAPVPRKSMILPEQRSEYGSQFFAQCAAQLSADGGARDRAVAGSDSC